MSSEKKVEVNEKGDNPEPQTDSSEVVEEKPVQKPTLQPVDESDPTKVVVRGVKGVVKWFSISKGFGFIHREDNDKDVFVHSTAIVQRDDRRWSYALSTDQEVEFDVVSGFKGPKAQAVTLPGGLPVETLRLYERNHRFRNPRNHQRRRSKSENADDSVKKESDGRRRYASDGAESSDDLKKDKTAPKRKSFSGRRRLPRKNKDDKVSESAGEEQARVEQKVAELVAV